MKNEEMWSQTNLVIRRPATSASTHAYPTVVEVTLLLARDKNEKKKKIIHFLVVSCGSPVV